MAAARLSLALLLVVLAVAGGRAAAQDYDFFYLVLQWPGSYCDTKQSCCYPKSGKPAADFGIHGLWPNRDDGSYPQNCSPDNAFNPSKVRACDSSPSSPSLPRVCLMPRRRGRHACSWVSRASKGQHNFVLTLWFMLLSLLLFD
jgi:ribonuclease I